MVVRTSAMAQQFLYRADVVPRLQQVSGKAMPKRMAARRLQYAGAAHRHLYRPLNHFFVHVMANRTARINILAIGVGGKNVLPTPLSRGIGIFAQQRSRERHPRRTRRPLLFESKLQFLQMHPQRMEDRPGTVTRSLPPFASRTISSERPKPTSLTRSRSDSINRRPLPYRRLATNQVVPSNCARTERTSEGVSTTGNRFGRDARVTFSSHGRLISST
jgi:hypothetical protein